MAAVGSVKFSASSESSPSPLTTISHAPTNPRRHMQRCSTWGWYARCMGLNEGIRTEVYYRKLCHKDEVLSHSHLAAFLYLPSSILHTSTPYFTMAQPLGLLQARGGPGRPRTRPDRRARSAGDRRR